MLTVKNVCCRKEVSVVGGNLPEAGTRDASSIGTSALHMQSRREGERCDNPYRYKRHRVEHEGLYASIDTATIVEMVKVHEMV